MVENEDVTVIRGWKAYALIIPVGLVLFAVWKMELWHTSDGATSIAPQDVTHEDDPTEQIRKRYGLRPIFSTEEGQRATALPDGIYGFTNCGLITSPEQSPVLYRRSVAGGANIIEIQKRQDGMLYLVGYASRDHVEQLEEGAKALAVSVSAHPTEDSFTLVELPLTRTAACEMQPFQKSFQLNVGLQ